MKKLQVRRAISRSVRRSSTDNGVVRAAVPGRLAQRAIAGASAHSVRIGSTAGHSPGRRHAISAAAITVSSTPPAMRR